MSARVHLAVESVSPTEAVGAFLAERDLAAGTRRKYRETLSCLMEDLGAERVVAEITGGSW